MGELLMPDLLKERVRSILEWKNLTLTGVYQAKPHAFEEVYQWLCQYGDALKPYICDTGAYLHEANAKGKSILFEAQLGALRDIELGIYPYTSSSSPLAAYAPLGAGIPGVRVDEVVGVVKAYSTCVGEGPFVSEWDGEQAAKLREAGGEYGAATGRPRRVGPFDVVATKYGAQLQGATCIALTKLDVLSYMETIPVCTGYRIDGKDVQSFPSTPLLEKAEPVYAYLPGWGTDIADVRDFSKLPEQAQAYVKYIEQAIGCPITYVSVGPDREALMYR